ncbi:MAG: GGDEF domain-containing protein [Xanthomonadales bacterium]|nr:GGDEF domain-containing protein [Xanthomonadales bacterium]MCP5476996.1 GGDEF domain-containing protein [Rhodanobacteraceae bacterium]
MAEREFDTLTTQRGSLAKLAEAIATKQSAFLTVTQGESQGRRLKLGDVPVTMGRSADCDFRLLNRAISRLHCRVWRDNSGFWVRDLNSTNKTYLNDRPVVEARLKDGDFITVGGTVVQFTQEKDVDHAAQSEFFDLVTHDQLTGLSQRRVFEQSLEQEIARSVRRGREFVLALLDVDELSRINREWGKAAGDDVLKQVARALKAGLREEDLLCRFGGEEFAALLPETGMEEAEKLLNAVRSAIANVEFFIQGESRSASVSIGAVLWTPEFKTAAATLEAAEQKLKAAKDAGRNRIVI